MAKGYLVNMCISGALQSDPDHLCATLVQNVTNGDGTVLKRTRHIGLSQRYSCTRFSTIIPTTPSTAQPLTSKQLSISC